MVSLPPSGMASRALTARLRIDVLELVRIDERRATGRRRARSRSRSARRACAAAAPTCRSTRRLTSTGLGSSGWRREKASRRWVSAAARCAPRMALSTERASRSESSAPPVGERALHRLQIADDDGQQVVEVVRDAAGQLADRLHLLRLRKLLLRALQRLLRLAPLGDVARDLGEADQLAGRIADRVDDDARPEGRAVLAHPPALGLELALAPCGLERARRHAGGPVGAV